VWSSTSSRANGVRAAPRPASHHPQRGARRRCPYAGSSLDWTKVHLPHGHDLGAAHNAWGGDRTDPGGTLMLYSGMAPADRVADDEAGRNALPRWWLPRVSAAWAVQTGPVLSPTCSSASTRSPGHPTARGLADRHPGTPRRGAADRVGRETRTDAVATTATSPPTCRH
jgi:hypothetical protein